AKSLCLEKINNGEALERFRQNVELQNGNPNICDGNSDWFEKVQTFPIKVRNTGFINEIDTLAIGESICEIGGGRTKIDDVIDFSVGYECLRKIGDEVKIGETVGVLHCRNESQFNLIGERLQTAYKISEEQPAKFELIKKIIS
ncbi:MAG: hypothetical protein K1X72_29270, partial [Pyrinomonadaceae bacterium]|nr:hypothetical protein [Pyrinomonadaceae bacterium]